MNRIFFRRIKQGVLQFVLIKPLTAVLAIVLHKNALYNEGEIDFKSSYVYIAFINNLSISVSLYCLILFYMATEERLKPFKPLPKFLCIKAILFFSFWQSIIITILINLRVVSTSTAYRIHYTLISIEMVIFSILQSNAFNYTTFIDTSNKKGNMLRTIG